MSVMRMAGCVAVLLGACGCAAFGRTNTPAPADPCVPANAYWCGDGTGTCCDMALPICTADGGCVADENRDPSDPITWRASRRGPRHR